MVCEGLCPNFAKRLEYLAVDFRAVEISLEKVEYTIKIPPLIEPLTRSRCIESRDDAISELPEAIESGGHRNACPAKEDHVALHLLIEQVRWNIRAGLGEPHNFAHAFGFIGIEDYSANRSDLHGLAHVADGLSQTQLWFAV